MRASVQNHLSNYISTMVSMATAKGLSANLDRYAGGQFAKANAYKTHQINHIEEKENSVAKAWKVYLNDSRSIGVVVSKEVLNTFVTDLNEAVNLFHKSIKLVK